MRKTANNNKATFTALQWGVMAFTLHGLPPLYLFQSLKEAKQFAKVQLEIWDNPRDDRYIERVRVYKITTTPIGEQIGLSVVNRRVKYDAEAEA